MERKSSQAVLDRDIAIPRVTSGCILQLFGLCIIMQDRFRGGGGPTNKQFAWYFLCMHLRKGYPDEYRLRTRDGRRLGQIMPRPLSALSSHYKTSWSQKPY